MSSPPRPKRPTPASQEMQHKKLKAPFRSPLVNLAAVNEGIEGVYSKGRPLSSPPRPAMKDEDNPPSFTREMIARELASRASKQFKSPISSKAGSSAAGQGSQSEGSFSNVAAAPLIKTLQAKVQVLKQAIRITQSSGGEDDLEALTKKWKTVGREVAWAIWDTIKDQDPGEGLAVGRRAGGWFDDDASGGRKTQGGRWGWEESAKDDAAEKEGPRVGFRSRLDVDPPARLFSSLDVENFCLKNELGFSFQACSVEFLHIIAHVQSRSSSS